MKRLLGNALTVGSTLVGASLAFATTVAAQTYSYDYTPYTATDAAAGGVFATFSIVLYCCLLCVPTIILIALAVYVYKDAQKHNVDNAALWALLTFFTGIIGLLVYLLAIKPEAVKKMEAHKPAHTDVTSTPKSE
jgi:cbb3-type cytochrome oxidase subunit 3